MIRRFPFSLAAALLLAASPGAVAAQAVVQPLPGTTDADRLGEVMRRVASDPRDVDALLRAGELSIDVGDLGGAAALFARAEKVDPRNGRVKAGMASILVRSERPGEALRYFAQAESFGWDARRFVADRALAYDLIGQQDRAQRDYRVALRDAPVDETVRRYALSLGISGKQALALQQLAPLLQKTDRGAWRARAFILAMTGDVPGAERIATTMMPAGMAQGLLPFFARLPLLPPSDRAFAVHFGEIHATPERIADARMAPPLPVLGADPTAPVMMASGQPARAPEPTSRTSRRADSRDRRARAGRVETAAVSPASTRQLAMLQPLPQTAPQLATRGVEQPARTTVVPTIVAQPAPRAPVAVQPAVRPPVATVQAVAPAVVTPSVPVRSVTERLPAATVVPAPATSSQILGAVTPKPVISAVTPTSSIAAITPTPSLAAVTPTPSVSVQAAPRASTDVAETVPTATRPIATPGFSSGTVTTVAIPGSAAGTAVTAPVAGPPARSDVAATTPSTAVVAPEPTVSGRTGDDSILARIVAGLSIPASELDVAPIVAAPASGAMPTVADDGARVVAEAKAKAQRDAAAKVVLARKLAAEKKAADKKAVLDKKALADKKAAAAEKAIADKEAAEEKRIARANPPRIWVQVAGGATEGDLPRAWKAVKAKAPTVFGSRAGWTTPLRATNRVLAGPFKTDAEARTFVNQLAKGGVSAFTFTSDAGQPVTRLPGK
ncbi:SPOR domain-containing protein [Sphingomonas sp. PB2P19]|uniref:SPOR domain-containing protein n=1 Tax=Sphingomonas rhamnosi TaxID=3096156 RepID=UPI002FC5FE93